MRIWKIHPKYLDCKGLYGQWLEAIIAKNSLISRDGHWYKHPQIDIFKNSKDPINAINLYLEGIWMEGQKRGYKFKSSYLGDMYETYEMKISITRKDLYNEMNILSNRVSERDPDWYEKVFITATRVEPHPLFEVVEVV